MWVSWIYKDALLVLDRQISLQWSTWVRAREVIQARQGFQKYLRADRHQLVQGAGGGIEALVAADQKQEAWKLIFCWFRQDKGKQASPLSDHLYRIATEREELYRCRPPEGIHVPILVMPA